MAKQTWLPESRADEGIIKGSTVISVRGSKYLEVLQTHYLVRCAWDEQINFKKKKKST